MKMIDVPATGEVFTWPVWLQSFNQDSNTGDIELTSNKAKAKRFETRAEALWCWRAISTTKPLRPDGKPNRPLTAFSVTIEHEGEEDVRK